MNDYRFHPSMTAQNLERWVYVNGHGRQGFKLVDGTFIIDGKFVVLTAEEQIERMTPERRAWLGF